MSREGRFRQRVLAAFRAHSTAACWVDVGCGGMGVGKAGEEGTPDIFWARGALELKVLSGWPAREDTIVRVGHLTRDQVRWGWDWEQGGGQWGLLVKVGGAGAGDGLYLFDARGAIEVHRGITRAGWRETAVWWGDWRGVDEAVKYILAGGVALSSTQAFRAGISPGFRAPRASR